MSTMIDRICKYCSKPFRAKLANVNSGKGKFCSKQCARASQRNRVIRKCKQCGKKFEKRASSNVGGYCSMQCVYDSLKKESPARICKHCQKPFHHYRDRGKYCSVDCFQSDHTNRIKLICNHCKKEFEVPKNKSNRKYCSRSCASKDKTSKHFCLQCGIEFQFPNSANRKFCSRECKNTYMTKEKIEVNCQECGNVFLVLPTRIKWGAKFCSRKCQFDTFSRVKGENHPLWRGGDAGYRGPNWIEQRGKALDRDNHTCQYCGKGKPKSGQSHHVHHIKPFKEFGYIPGKNDFYIHANNLSNLITLCKKCHGKAEFDKIVIQPKLF